MTRSIFVQYSDPEDPGNEYITEFAKIGGILIGIGAAPILQEQVSWFWAVGLSVGIITILAACGYWLRQSLRSFQPGSKTLSRTNKVLYWFRESVKTAFQSVSSRIRQIWERGNKNDRGAEKHVSEHPSRIVTVLPIVTFLIGSLIIIASLVAYLLQSQPQIINAGAMSLYFSAPAVLLWMIGEVVDLYPHFLVIPKHRPQVLGIAKSGLQIASALFLWVYLGVAIGMERAAILLLISAIMAIAGAGLGIASIHAQQIAAQPKATSPVPNHV